MTTSLYEIQKELLQYFRGKPTSELLSKQALDELSIYKSLINNSMDDLLSRIYPHCKRFLENDWQNIVLDYTENYPAISAVFNQAASEFHKFLNSDLFRHKYTKLYKPFLTELAYYEWLEIELYNQVQELGYHANTDGLRLNTISHFCKFEYPISKIIRDSNLENLEKEQELLFVFREKSTLNVKYYQLNSYGYLLLKGLADSLSVEEIIDELAEISNLDKVIVEREVKTSINNFKEICILFTE